MGEDSDIHFYISQILAYTFDDLLVVFFVLSVVLLLIFSNVSEALFRISKRQLVDTVADEKRSQLENLFLMREKLNYSSLIGSFISILFIFSLSIYWTSNHFDDFRFNDVLWGCLITFAVNLICSNVAATLFAQQKPAKVLRFLLPIQVYFMYLFYPIILIIEMLQKVFGRFIVDQDRDENKIAEDRILEAVSEASELTLLTDEGEKMIMQVLELKETSASEVMTPRTDMVSVSQDAMIPEALKLAHEHGHSRIPVFKETRDVIVGIFYTRDLLPLFADGVDISTMKVNEIMRQSVMIPETKNIVKLLQDLKREKLSMVILVDEYGGTAGLVTLEDVLEEIVGDIRDEYDEDEVDYSIVHVNDKDNRYEADGRCRLDRIKDELGVELPEDEDYDTLGGYLSFMFGHVPEAGKEIEDDFFSYEIVKADERKIEKVLLKRKITEGKDHKTSQRFPKTQDDPT